MRRPAVTVLRAAIGTACLLAAGYFVVYAVAMLENPPELGRAFGMFLLGIAGLFILCAAAAAFVRR
jgi:hypothetical protein